MLCLSPVFGRLVCGKLNYSGVLVVKSKIIFWMIIIIVVIMRLDN